MGGIALLFQAWLVAALLSLNLAAPAPSPNFRGIALQDEAYYKTETIRCKDGSKSFSSDRLNDDFCDCADATDEPGTSACPNGKFHCRNKGHTPVEIFSSRVNDGICDCCDGSDEYDGKAKCSNTCSQAGKVMREKLERKIATFKGGLEVRKRDVDHAKQMIAKEKVELLTLKQEEKQLKDQVQRLKAKKEEIEKAEQQEKLKREKEEKARKQAEMKDAKAEAIEEEKAKAEATEEEKAEVAKDDQILEEHMKDHEEEKFPLDDDKDIVSSEHNPEGLSKEELGRLIASRWTGENPNIEKEGARIADDNHDAESQGMYGDDADHERDEDEVSTEDEDDEEDEKDVADDQDEAEETGSLGDVPLKEGPWWTKLKDKIKEFSDSIFAKSPVNKSEAEYVRKEYKDSTSKLTEIQSKVSDLEKKLEQDFGKDGEFYSLYGQCFELRQQKYTYKVCPFRHGVQVEGHSTTTLGNWDGFKDEYRSMHFVRGDRCWNGPDRSLKVTLRCGSKVELRDVDEPSRCEYVAELSTPAVCLQERLAALEQRLHNLGDVSHHDEL